MPIVYQKKHLSHTLAIWESTEDHDFLIKKAVLSDEEKVVYRTFKSESRQREFLTVRALLNELFPDNKFVIRYSSNGKPTLTDSKNISISHTKNFVGILVGEFKHAGIDLEMINER